MGLLKGTKIITPINYFHYTAVSQGSQRDDAGGCHAAAIQGGLRGTGG